MMNQTQEQPSTESTKPEATFSEFVVGCDFFTERVTLPAGLKAAELDSAILTQLEGISPFSSEQLSWGAFLDPDANQALVYAALTSNLEQNEREPSEHFLKPRFPTFLPFLGYVAERPCILCVVCGRTLSLLVYDEPGKLPKEVHSVCVEEGDITLDMAHRMQADLLRDLPWINLPVEVSIYFLESLKWNWKHEIITRSKEGGSGIIELALDRQQIYLADIRPVPIKRKALSGSRFNLISWVATAGALTVMVLMLLLSGVHWIWNIQIDKKLATVESRKERVALIEAKNRNLAMFESGAAARLQPLAMLDIVNRYRPDGLFFSEVKAFEGNRMQIEGVAEENGTALVNQFKDQLQPVGAIRSSNVEITRISRGATYFRCSIEFNELELADVGAHN